MPFGPTPTQRAVIDKTILDSLIRAKLSSLNGCKGVEPLPVAWREPHGSRCNWHVPGWVGDAGLVRQCVDKMSQYLNFLEAQFDIPPERSGG